MNGMGNKNNYKAQDNQIYTTKLKHKASVMEML